MSSTAEAETGDIYMGRTKEGIPIRTAAIELGHPQPKDRTKFNTDNSRPNTQPKLSKSFDISFGKKAREIK